ncbi:MAG: hypothetical protein H6944_11145 [Zoogloeaceae bacterium]|uniref:hypothetical protein n=1 Tax=Denitromonas sp. TaxID=2734609 RepID=UPI001D8579A8|nr:hypothetical protein [Rhodocyclaceae bacterium]MCP5222230.1 hypothetical protein [Zoogloeaceae bacterium]HQU88731.1 hypothetical protein [Denitromonas sp.]
MMIRCLAAIGLMLASVLSTPVSAAGAILCCENADGRRVCGDVLPQACYGRAYRRVASDGTVIERIAAPMSDAERIAAERESRLRELEDARRRSQRLQDRALLDTYRSAVDIDQRESRAIGEIERDLAKARERLNQLKHGQERLQEEAKLHPAGAVPEDLTQAIRDNQSELAAQETVIDAKLKNIDAVRARYSRDRERYRALTSTAAGR